MRELLDMPTPSVEEFLTRWYGPPDQAATEVRTGHHAAQPLIDWFATTTQWTQRVACQNTMVPPEDVTIEDGKAIFWIENQAVWVWGYDPGDDDLAVYDRINVAGKPWNSSGMRLSTFLVQATVFEAVLCTEHNGSAPRVNRDQLDTIQEPLNPLPGPEWNWPAPGGFRLYAADDLLAFAGPNVREGVPAEAADRWSVFIAARDPAPLAFLSNVAGVVWD